MKKSEFKQWSEEMFLTEINYKDFKNDPSKTSKRKINEAISKMNGVLSVLERTIRQNIKLKNETMDGNDKVLWKTTEGKMERIHTRMNSIFELFQKLKSN
jgi:hypothetical protein